MSLESENVNLHRFAHEAMATRFQVSVAGETRTYAQQAADAVFAEVDLVEAALSRYVESSDMARLNRLAAGRTARIGLRAFECLEIAAQVHADTGGAFDVTVGPLLACWRNPDKSPRKPSEQELTAARARVGMHLVELDPNTFSVRLKAEDMSIDLGGIGKGFALDRAAELLAEWGVGSALIGSESTVLAVGAPPGRRGWSAAVGGADKDTPPVGKVFLRDNALSASGVYIKGRHIIDPRTGRPAAGKRAAWAVSKTGAVADALSTAFMVLSPKTVERYCLAHPGTFAMLLLESGGEGRYRRFGNWDETLGLQSVRSAKF